MSRDTNAICRQCGVFQADIGLNWTLIERGTLKEFDEELLWRFNMTPEQLPHSHPSARIRRFLVRHEGHGEVEFWSWDWAYSEDDPLEGLREETWDAGTGA